MRNLLIALMLFGTLFQVGFSQNFDKTKLDQYFNALEENNKFMGSIAIAQNGEVVYQRAIGFADVENKIKADEGSKYRIGSISKTFTAVLILKAVEEGKLQLDQTIDKYFPSIKNSEKITVKHLLYHRSGIHSFTNDEDYFSWNTEEKTEEEMLVIIAKGGSDFEPDSKAEYSNSNYVLLTYLLEKSFDLTYPKLLKFHITQPIGLTSTYLGGVITTDLKECKSYKYTGDWELESETDISIPLGAGGIVSTPTDLVKFSDALFGGKLMKKESLEMMKTLEDQFGMGLFQFPFHNKTGYGHTGGIDGFSAVFTHFSDGDVSFAMTSNGTNFNNNDISIVALSAAFNKPYEIPEFSTYAVSSEDLDQYLGVYASKQIPLKITVTKENNTLFAQATGQAAFPLEAIEKDEFKFDQAGIVMEFDPAASAMVLKQGGGVFEFKKE